uniref:Ig-like domain-containing protein n=1 Tax=Sparus aurata TaxID=8175 RepID=A0A671Z3M1_SPAAU
MYRSVCVSVALPALLALTLVSHVSQACPRSCNCYQASEVHCTFRSLFTIPPGLPAHTRRINLGFNSISRIHDSSLAGLKKVELLMLHSNDLHNLPDGVFRDMKSLQILKLSYNKLREISSSLTFSGLTSLLRLYLDHNLLQHIHPRALLQLPSLRLLRLQGNRLHQLHPNTLCTLSLLNTYYFSTLRHVDLSNNSLTTLPRETIATAPLLETLVLQANPWSCDCRMNWFFTWIQAHPGLMKCPGGPQCPICGSPDSLQGQGLLEQTDLLCTSPIIPSPGRDTPSETEISEVQSTEYFREPLGSASLGLSDQLGNSVDLSCNITHSSDSQDIAPPPDLSMSSSSPLPLALSLSLECPVERHSYEKLWRILAYYSETAVQLEREIMLSKAPALAYRYRQTAETDGYYHTGVKASVKVRPQWLLQPAISIQLNRAQSNGHKVQLIYSTRVSAHPDSTSQPSTSYPTSHPWVLISTYQATPALAAAAGSKVELPCPLLSSANPKVEWILPDGSKHISPSNSLDGRLLATTSGLLLNKVQLSDSGIYYCIARAGRDVDVLPLRLAVEESSFPPSGEQVGPPVTGTVGEPVSLSCMASGSPVPHMSWVLPDGNIVRRGLAVSGGLTIQSNGSLFLSNPSRRDAGHYRCIAVNQYGSDSLSMQLQLYSRHPPPLRTPFPRGPQSAAGRSTKIRAPLLHQVEEGSGDEGEEEEKPIIGNRRRPRPLQPSPNRRYPIGNPRRRGPVREGPLRRGGAPVSPTDQRRTRFENRHRVTTNKQRIDPQKWADILAKIRQKTAQSNNSQSIAAGKPTAEPGGLGKEGDTGGHDGGDDIERGRAAGAGMEAETEGSSVDDSDLREEGLQPIQPVQKTIPDTETNTEIMKETEKSETPKPIENEAETPIQTEKAGPQTQTVTNLETRKEPVTSKPISGTNEIASEPDEGDEREATPNPSTIRPQNPRQGLFPNLVPNSRPQNPWNSRRRIGQRRRINRPRGRPLNPTRLLPDLTNLRSQTTTPETTTAQIDISSLASTSTSPAILLTQSGHNGNKVSLTPPASNTLGISTLKSASPSQTPSSSSFTSLSTSRTKTPMMTHSANIPDAAESTLSNTPTPSPTQSDTVDAHTDVADTDGRTNTHGTQTHTETHTALGKHADRPPSKHSEELERNLLGVPYVSHSSISVSPTLSSTSSSPTAKITTPSTTPKSIQSTSSATTSTTTTTLPTTTTTTITTSPTMSTSTTMIIPTSSNTRSTSTTHSSTTGTTTTLLHTFTTPTTTTTTTTTTSSTTSTSPSTTTTTTTTTTAPILTSTTPTTTITLSTSPSTASTATTSATTTTDTPTTSTRITISAETSPTTTRSATPSTPTTTTMVTSTSTTASSRQRPSVGKVDPRGRPVSGAPTQSRPPTDWKNPGKVMEHFAHCITDFTSRSATRHLLDPPFLCLLPTLCNFLSQFVSVFLTLSPHFCSLSDCFCLSLSLSGAVMSIHSRAQRFEVLPNGTLVIQNVQLQDRGTYICSAHSFLGRDRLLTTLEVWTRPPRMQLASYREVTIHQGGEVHLECQADGVPSPLLSWVLPDRSVLTSTAPSTSRITMDTNGTLHISVTLPSDRGVYRCVASNSAGAASASVRVHVSSMPPVIQQPREEHLLLSPGRPVYAHCSARGAPPPVLRWRIPDGTLVRPSQFLHGNLFVLPNGTLHIRKVGPKDSGNYECIASNAVGAHKRIVKVEIEAERGKARIVSTSPSITTVYYGGVLQLHCSVTGNPAPIIIWRTPNRKLVDMNFSFDQRLKVHPNGSLSVQAVTEKDAGDYLCIARNKVADDYRLLRVSVATKPAKIEPKQPINQMVMFGKPLKVDCQASGLPDPAVRWSLPDGTMVNSVLQGEERGGRVRRLTVFDNGTLLVPAVGMGEEGEYTCYAENQGGQDTMKVKVKVMMTSPPTFSDDRSYHVVKVRQGMTATIHCQATGDPAPTLTWFSPTNRVIPQSLGSGFYSERVVVVLGGTLEVRMAQKIDTGNYTCRASNLAGGRRIVVGLEVEGGRSLSTNNGPGSVQSSRSGDNINNAGIIQNGFTNGVTSRSNNSSINGYSDNNGRIRNFVPNTGVSIATSGFNPALRSDSHNGFNRPVSGVTTQLGSSGISTGLSRNIGITADNTGINRNGPGILSSQHSVGNSHRGDSADRNPGTNNNEVIAGKADARDTAGNTGTKNSSNTVVGLVTTIKQRALKGQTVLLPCPSQGSPPPRLAWLLPGNGVLPAPYYGSRLTDGTLTVHQASVFDRGTYTCRSTSFDSSSVSVVTVPVIVIAYPPRITMGPSPVTYTRPGVAVELPCLTIATPKATVTWETPDLTQLRVMGQARIYGNRYLSPQGSLVIQNPTSRDTGFYRCTAKNVIGVDTKATYLHVI